MQKYYSQNTFFIALNLSKKYPICMITVTQFLWESKTLKELVVADDDVIGSMPVNDLNMPVND